MGEEDHVAREVLLKLVAKVWVRAQSMRAFSLMKTPSSALSLRSLSLALLSTNAM